MTVLHKPASRNVLAKVAAGDLVDLRTEEHRLVVQSLQGECLGEVEPKLANRLLKLMRQGNRYSGAVVSVQHQSLAVALREVYTHPDLLGVASFPYKGSDDPMAYLRDTYARLDLEADAEDDDIAPDWGEPDEASPDQEGQPERAPSAHQDLDDDDDGE